MKKRSTGLILCGGAMLCLILDSRCAAASTRTALSLCMETVIPSLFPLFVVSGLAVGTLRSVKLPFLAKLLRLPVGSEGIFLLGLVGGYPLGAQCIVQAKEQHLLSKEDARRMLGFCNNCGPAFLFGILGPILGGIDRAAAVLLIQAEAALIVGSLWPGEAAAGGIAESKPISLPQAVTRAVRSMVSICAWVVLARVLLGFLQRWLFPFLPGWAGILLAGIMEVTSGCLNLDLVESQDLRFILACGMVSFGGISVLLQIRGLTEPAGIGIRTCTAQKCLQGLLATGIGALYIPMGLMGPVMVACGILLKIVVEISQRLVYNRRNKGGIPYALSEEDRPFLRLLHPMHPLQLRSDALHQTGHRQ